MMSLVEVRCKGRPLFVYSPLSLLPATPSVDGDDTSSVRSYSYVVSHSPDHVTVT